MATNWKTGRLRAGKLRHRCDIVKVSAVQDSTGGFNLSADTIYANVWCSIEATGGSEALAAESQTSVVSHQVVIRYIGAAPSWQSNTQYPAGALCLDTNGNLQQAQSAGLSGLAAPQPWSQVVSFLTSDGNPSTGIEWNNLGVAPPYTGVTAALQVWFNGRQFQITSVQNPDEKNKMLALMCVEINDSRQQITSQPKDLN
jgi:head-tail adaptor